MDYKRATLERRAAEYYMELRLPKDKWKSFDDLEPQLEEFKHLLKAGDDDAAAQLMEEIDLDYLFVWGHTGRTLAMRQQLNAIKDKKLKGLNLNGIGLAYFHQGQFDKAIEHHELALWLARDTNDQIGECRYLGNLGNAFREKGEREKAISCYQQALLLAVQIPDRHLEATNLGSLGITYAEIGQIKQAVEYYEQAIKIFRELGDAKAQRGVPIALVDMAINYSELGDYERADELYQEILKIVREISFQHVEEVALINYGRSRAEQGYYEEALKLYEQAVRVAEAISDRRGIGFSELYMARIHIATNDLASAAGKLTRAIDVADEIKMPALSNPAYSTLAEIHMRLAEVDKAAVAITKALPFAINDDEEGHKTFTLHGIILARQGKQQEARDAFKKGLEAAEALLKEADNLFAAKFTRGLAFAGLAVIAEGDPSGRTAEQYQNDAIAAYKEATNQTKAAGILKDAENLLDLLKPIDKTGVLEPIRTVLGAL